MGEKEMDAKEMNRYKYYSFLRREPKPSKTPKKCTKFESPVGKKKKFKPNEPCPCGSGVKFKKCCDRDLYTARVEAIEKLLN
jgi:uncharacterized protein YecA (UPF0149 family)